MNYWIFKANPEQYRLDARLADPYPFLTWPVTRYHERIQPGDIVFLWRGGQPRGICATLEVVEMPYQPADDPYEGFALSAGSMPESEHWARCKFLERGPFLEMGVIKKIEGLELFSFFSAFPQAYNFSIHRPEGSILLEFLKTYQPAAPAPRKEAAPRAPRTSSTGGTARASASPRHTAASSAQPAVHKVQMMRCQECGRIVLFSETERHENEVHGGPVVWKKMG